MLTRKQWKDFVYIFQLRKVFCDLWLITGTKSLQPDGVILKYFKLWLFDLTEFKVWNIKCL